MANIRLDQLHTADVTKQNHWQSHANDWEDDAPDHLLFSPNNCCLCCLLYVLLILILFFSVYCEISVNIGVTGEMELFRAYHRPITVVSKLIIQIYEITGSTLTAFELYTVQYSSTSPIKNFNSIALVIKFCAKSFFTFVFSLSLSQDTIQTFALSTFIASVYSNQSKMYRKMTKRITFASMYFYGIDNRIRIRTRTTYMHNCIKYTQQNLIKHPSIAK